MKNYERGYEAKIQYWVEVLGGVDSLEGMTHCIERIKYFSKKQSEWIIAQKIKENNLVIG